MRVPGISRRTIARLTTTAAVVCLGLLGTAVPAHASNVIAFVAYFDDANFDHLVGSSTFSDCPGDPSYHWGLYTDYYTISSEPCG